MARILFFYLGLLLMSFSLFFPIFPIPPNERWNPQTWLFRLGLVLAIGAHGWPGGF